jgi:hypothetical protein
MLITVVMGMDKISRPTSLTRSLVYTPYRDPVFNDLVSKILVAIGYIVAAIDLILLLPVGCPMLALPTGVAGKTLPSDLSRPIPPWRRNLPTATFLTVHRPPQRKTPAVRPGSVWEERCFREFNSIRRSGKTT